MCDDECPHCGARYDAYESEELTTLIEEERGEFVVLWSPETVEHDPDYRELGRFPTREKAIEFSSVDGRPECASFRKPCNGTMAGRISGYSPPPAPQR
jgi:hypothetical protein